MAVLDTGASKEISDRLSAEAAQTPRQRMVSSAATLIREHGVHGVGLRQVVAHSEGPRGSLQRYFPGGKTQLVSEAIALAVLHDVAAGTRAAYKDAPNLPEAIGMIVAPWRRLLTEFDFAQGCSLAATVIDAADNDTLRTEVSKLFTRWHKEVAAVYVKFGHPKSVARDKAWVLISAIEGAIVIARAQRSVSPLDAVERHFVA